MKINYQKRKQCDLHGGGNYDRPKRVPRQTLQMQALECACKGRFEKFIAVVRALELTLGFAFTPKQTLAKAA